MKVPFSCSSCQHTWNGKPLAERKTEPRCPQCKSRAIIPMEGSLEENGVELPSSPTVLQERELKEFELEPIEFDVDIEPHPSRKPKPKLTKQQIDQLVKSSRSSMRELCSMGYTGLIMIINFWLNSQLPPPSQDEVRRFAEAWLSITRSHKTFGTTMRRIPILGLIAIHFDFFLKRRRFFSPPKPKETTRLKDTEPEEPTVVPVQGKSPFTARLRGVD